MRAVCRSKRIGMEFATCHNVTAQAFADGATYLQLMERNVQALREALN